MPLTIHHMQVSQSERILWLCEELNVPYDLVLHQRDPFFSPQSIKALNPLGQSPVIQDGDLRLFESAACCEYIIHKHGNGRLALSPSHKNYADYLYWFHFANGTFQPQALMLMQVKRADPSMSGPIAARYNERFTAILEFMDERLKENTWLAGEEFTAADIMNVFTLTTMRAFSAYELTGYEGILGYLKRLTEREGYKRARAKGDPELELMIGGETPKAFAERLKEAGKL